MKRTKLFNAISAVLWAMESDDSGVRAMFVAPTIEDLAA